jgi:hypothetical protein
MIRYKTSSSKDSYHIVLLDVMPYMQTFWSQNNAIDLTEVLKTYKTLLGAQKAVKEGYVIVWEKGMSHTGKIGLDRKF